ncbi:hypothetical protein D9M71_790350 [compost metagenome]
MRVADLDNGLQRGGEVAAVVVQHRRARAQLLAAGRGITVGAKVIVEAPATDALAQVQHLWRRTQVADLIVEAVEIRRVLGQHVPLTPLAGAHHCALAIYQQAGRTIERTCPDAFALDLRVKCET